MMKTRAPGIFGSALTFGGATGTNLVNLTDNLASALDFTEGSNTYLKFVTTDSGEYIAVGKAIATGQGSIGFSAASGSNVLSVTDNLADALSVVEGANAYLTVVTTDSAEAINVKKRMTVTDGVASGTARRVGGMASVGISAADTVTAATSNNAFVSFASTYSIPASTLGASTIVRIRALVVVNNASGTDTLTCNLLLGSTSLIATTAVDPGATTDLHILEYEITSRAAASATSSLTGSGRWITNTGGTIAHGTGLLAPTNFATNGALVISSQAKWSSNTASTSARLEQLNVEII